MKNNTKDSTWSFKPEILEPKIEDKNSSSTVLLLGSGRLARHLSYYFSQHLHVPVTQLSWRECLNKPESFFFDETGSVLSQVGGKAEKKSSVKSSVKYSLCFLLGRDSDLLTQQRWLVDRGARLPLVHCSGRVVIHGVSAWHPLGSFSEKLFPLSDYKKIPFVGDELSCPLGALIPELPNKSFIVPRSSRELYHALCVFSANLSAILWAHVFSRAERELHLPGESFQFLMESSTQNALNEGIEGITGPITRGDFQSMERNLHALQKPAEADVYQAVLKLFTENKKLQRREGLSAHVDL